MFRRGKIFAKTFRVTLSEGGPVISWPTRDIRQLLRAGCCEGADLHPGVVLRAQVRPLRVLLPRPSGDVVNHYGRRWAAPIKFSSVQCRFDRTNWTNLSSRATATNTTMPAVDSTVTDPQRFYRVQLLP